MTLFFFTYSLAGLYRLGASLLLLEGSSLTFGGSVRATNWTVVLFKIQVVLSEAKRSSQQPVPFEATIVVLDFFATGLSVASTSAFRLVVAGGRPVELGGALRLPAIEAGRMVGKQNGTTRRTWS